MQYLCDCAGSHRCPASMTRVSDGVAVNHKLAHKLRPKDRQTLRRPQCAK